MERFLSLADLNMLQDSTDDDDGLTNIQRPGSFDWLTRRRV